MNADQIWRAIESRVLRAIQGYKPSSLAMFPVPVSYTPVWASTGTQPSIGDGTLVGRYALRGKMCLLTIAQVMGSTTTYGSGRWSWSLPLAARSSVSVAWQGIANVVDVSAGLYQTMLATIDPGQNVLTYFTQAAPTSGIYLTPTVPITWASGDFLRIQIEYEIE